MTDIQRLDETASMTSNCLPKKGAIKLSDLYVAVGEKTAGLRLGDFRAAVLQLIDRGEAEYRGSDQIERAAVLQ